MRDVYTEVFAQSDGSPIESVPIRSKFKYQFIKETN
jgi:hypothetical protein